MEHDPKMGARGTPNPSKIKNVNLRSLLEKVFRQINQHVGSVPGRSHMQSIHVCAARTHLFYVGLLPHNNKQSIKKLLVLESFWNGGKD